MGVLHNLKIEPTGSRLQCARVIVDGEPIMCRGYTISHSIDEIPVAELEMVCVPNYDHDVLVNVSNKEEIARLMDEREFKEFCKIWKEVYNE